MPRATKEKKSKAKGASRRQAFQASNDASRDGTKLWPLWRCAGVIAALGPLALAFASFGRVHLSKGGTLSSQDFLEMVQRSRSIQLVDSDSHTLAATADISEGTVLVEIPRELMIWDLDAARDDFVQSQLFPLVSKEHLDVASKQTILLSAYLALLRKKEVPPSREFPHHISVALALPSHDELASAHPVLADPAQMRRLLGEHSFAYMTLLRARRILDKEYDLLSGSTAFSSRVSREEYMSCRVAVQSRAFSHSNIPESELPEQERQYYLRAVGVDFRSQGSSIAPVNDWMNHHFNNNAKAGVYDANTRSTQARAVKAIGSGQEIINSYGKRPQLPDYLLFAQYGFVPTDGTGTSLATLFAHDIYLTSTQSASRKMETMIPYLQYDYGHRECIRKESHPEAFELKRLKLQYLTEIALDQSHWLLALPSRTSTGSTPNSTTELPNDYTVPSFGPEVYQYIQGNEQRLYLPCILISMTDGDLPDASSLLMQDLETLKRSSAPERTRPLKLQELRMSPNWALRSLYCVQALATAQVQKYDSSVEQMEAHIMDVASSGRSATDTLEWNAAHMQLEEMQSQEALRRWVTGQWDKWSGTSDELFIRNEPCPEEYSAELAAPSSAY